MYEEKDNACLELLGKDEGDTGGAVVGDDELQLGCDGESVPTLNCDCIISLPHLIKLRFPMALTLFPVCNVDSPFFFRHLIFQSFGYKSAFSR